MKSDFLKKEEHGLSWVDLHAPSEEELAEAGEQFALPAFLIKECLDSSVLPKYEEHGSTKFILLRSFHRLENGINVEELTSRLAVFITEECVVTLHRTGWDQILKVREQVYAELRRDNARIVALAMKQAQGTSSISEKQPRRNPHFKQLMLSEKLQSDIVFYMVKEVLESFESPMDTFEERFEMCEEKIFSHESDRALFAQAYTLKRQLFSCHRALRMNLDVSRKLDNLLQRHTKALEYLRADSERFLGLVDAEIDNVHNLITLQMSLQSNHTNEIMRVLAIFSAFFMPLTFIAGVYGMNFKFMPELEHPMGYGFALGLMLCVSAVIYWYFRKKRWIGRSAELVDARSTTDITMPDNHNTREHSGSQNTQRDAFDKKINAA